MIGPVALGDEPGVGQLVEAALLEADRERAQRLRELLGRECGERGRVDPTGEQDAYGNVGHEMRPNGVTEPGPKLLDQLGLVVVAAPRLR